MKIELNLSKLKTKNTEPVQYYLPETDILLNDYLGKKITIKFLNELNCAKCGRKTNKLYGEGFCYHCFLTAPEADSCVVKPELCQAHIGISRDMEWSKTHCLVDHYVYLAITDKVKVGVTRYSQIPTRWIDQGAIKAIKIAKTPYRQLAGEIEVNLKKVFSDKTNWQKMLTNSYEEADLYEERKKVVMNLAPYLKKYLIYDNTIYEFSYPITSPPSNIQSTSLEKTPQIKGILTGIKGQYLIFDNSIAFNIRRHTGYKVSIEIEN